MDPINLSTALAALFSTIKALTEPIWNHYNRKRQFGETARIVRGTIEQSGMTARLIEEYFNRKAPRSPQHQLEISVKISHLFEELTLKKAALSANHDLYNLASEALLAIDQLKRVFEKYSSKENDSFHSLGVSDTAASIAIKLDRIQSEWTDATKNGR
ncbi:hypothetical protein OPU71_04650 [Niveibacterium sp. 24ML]|uniref:hypothetical protein n=1 Tax=Niveibacterium sp. 24ML TaxID=2985512 RepID=UPI00226DA4F3|nr:hypothetical protein [Niveibacterium sp. 24ML]MCX9155408.1 hypothetical protein [Niveibacterium sp. 24ML]